METVLLILAAVAIARRWRRDHAVLPGHIQDTEPGTIDYYDRLVWGGIYAARPGGTGRGFPAPSGGGGGGRTATGSAGGKGAGVSG